MLRPLGESVSFLNLKEIGTKSEHFITANNHKEFMKPMV
jgi:hypothetical protein